MHNPPQFWGIIWFILSSWAFLTDDREKMTFSTTSLSPPHPVTAHKYASLISRSPNAELPTPKALCHRPRRPCLLFPAEPPASEGQLHGGVGGGSEEAAARLPLHRSAALRQTEETDRRVRHFNDGQINTCCSETSSLSGSHWFKFQVKIEPQLTFFWIVLFSFPFLPSPFPHSSHLLSTVTCPSPSPAVKTSSTTVSGTSPWLTWPSRAQRRLSHLPSPRSPMKSSMPWRSRSPTSAVRSRGRR